jgi:hypothetical protein
MKFSFKIGDSVGVKQGVPGEKHAGLTGWGGFI